MILIRSCNLCSVVVVYAEIYIVKDIVAEAIVVLVALLVSSTTGTL